jgi:hypothetical protein
VSTTRRPNPSRRLRPLLALAAALAVLAVVPLWPWRPTCRCDTVWQGDLRDVYVDEFTDMLDRSHVYYWRFGDLVLLRAIPWFDGDDFWSQADAVYNWECKVAEAVSEDQVIDGVLHRAPEAVERLRAKMASRIGPDPRFAPDGTRKIAADTRVTRFCPLFRAAILDPPSPTGR